MSDTKRIAAFHRTVWRWHFWAGLIVAPFLLMLSVTGAIYLFNDELNDLIYSDLWLVAPHASDVPVSRMIAAALAAHPGAVSRVDLPATGTRAAVVYVAPHVVTGLPWAGISGDLLQRASAAAGVGYPASFRTHNAPHSVTMKAALGQVPWTLEAAPMPRSAIRASVDEHAGHAGHEMPAVTEDAAAIAGIDRVVDLLASRGLSRGYWLYLPSGPDGVYTAVTYPDRPQGQRTIYVDRYSLRQIGPEVRFADYGIVGRAIELGVQLHMGNYFGRLNQLLMLLPCVAIWVLTVSGVAMWWKRRPRGSLGAPAPIAGARAWGLIVALVVGGVLLPLFGASLLLIAALDWLVGRLRPARRFAVA
jgi:uncharacterized iron-regulated membrane protein